MHDGKTLSIKTASQAADAPSEQAASVEQADTSVEAGNTAAPAEPDSEAKGTAPNSPNPRTNLQDSFLNTVRKNKATVTIFLVKGVKLQGIITWFDNFSILLRRENQTQLVYKHSISTIMPSQPMDPEQFVHGGSQGRKKTLQDIFLSSVRESEVGVTMFLINGVMLQGRIAAFDLFCVLLEREGYVQLAYKHALSTVQPAGPVDLSNGTGDEPEGGLG